MDYLAKAQVFALFAIPSIMAFGIAELGAKYLHIVSRILFYLAGGVSALCAIVLPFLQK